MTYTRPNDTDPVGVRKDRAANCHRIRSAWRQRSFGHWAIGDAAIGDRR